MVIEQRIRNAETQLFASLDLDVEESFLPLERTGLNVRVLMHGSGPPLLLLHGVSLSAAVWAPLFRHLAGWRLLAVDLPGHGLSDPVVYRRGSVREHTRQLIDDMLDALELDEAPVIGYSLGGMFALWYAATGAERLTGLVAMGDPAVALPGVRVRMPLSLLTVPGVGRAVLRLPSPPAVYRRLLARGLGSGEVTAAPATLLEVLHLASRRSANARTVATLMHAIDRFRRPRTESVLTGPELAAIRIPTMFIWGRDDPYLSPQNADASIKQIPRATLHELAAGHGPWLVSLDATANLIHAHLAETRERYAGFFQQHDHRRM